MILRNSFFLFIWALIFQAFTQQEVYGQCSVNAGADTTICSGQSFRRTAIYQPLAGSVRWYQLGNATPVSFTPTIDLTLTTAGSFRFICEVSSALCPLPKYDTVLVTVSQSPLVPNQTVTICSGGMFTVSPINNPPTTQVTANTTFTWTVVPNSNVTGLSNQTTPRSTISQTLTNNTNIVQTVEYTVTPKSGLCTGAPFTVTVTVNPKPKIGNKATTICSESRFSVRPLNNQPVEIVPIGTKYTWTVVSNPNVTGQSNQTVGQDSITQVLYNLTATPQVVVYRVVPLYLSCVGDTFTISVTVNPRPIIQAQTATISSGTAFLFAPVNNPPTTIVPSGTSYTWLVDDNPNVLGETNQATPRSNISQTLTNSTSISQNVGYLITPLSQTCLGTSFDAIVTVFGSSGNKPTANFSSTTTCGRTVAFTNLSSTPSGTITSYQWIFDVNNPANTSTQANPTFTYPLSDVTFTAQLIVTNSLGLRDTVRRSIITNAGPIAELVSEQEITTINGVEYFYACTSGDSTFTFYNNSRNFTPTSTYSINWGDGGVNNYTQTTFGAPVTTGMFATHRYQTGIYSLTFIISDGACSDTVKYKVYVGNIPSGGIVGLPASTICAGGQQGVVVSGTSNNTPGTIYTLTYNDGTPSITMTAPIQDPDTIYHTFNTSSCGTSSTSGGGTINNSFGAYLIITSPCGTRAGSVVPIYVASKPTASFTSNTSDSICVGQIISFNNTSTPGNNNVNGVCTPGKSVWQITPTTPGTRYALTSGSLGSLITSNPVNWNSGSDALQVRFDSAGTYTVRVIVANNSFCGRDTMTKTIRVIQPFAPVVVSPISYNQGAIALPLSATGTGLRWYSAQVGGVGSTTAPVPSTATIGSTTYYVSQGAPSCESQRASIVVTVGAGSTQRVGINVTQPQRSLHVSDIMRLEPRSAPPTNPAEGDIYYDGVLKMLRYYNGTTWKNL